MNDRNPVAEAGQDLLDRVWDIETFRDKLRVDLEVADGDDLLDQLDASAMAGDPTRLQRVVERVGGISGLLGIVTEVVRLEELRNDALDRYVKARRAAENPEPERENADGEYGFESGEPIVPGFSDVPLEDLR